MLGVAQEVFGIDDPTKSMDTDAITERFQHKIGELHQKYHKDPSEEKVKVDEPSKEESV